jgi:TolB-like protein
MGTFDPAEPLRLALAERYRFVRALGEGGMATVFLVEDLKHTRFVALKVFKQELGAAERERFKREIRITAGLQHPNILAVLDSGEAAGHMWYAMPFVAGESLRDRLSRERQLPIGDALAITREVGDALAFAHALGIVHRDVKPENILLADGHAHVADFGIARALNDASAERLTRTGTGIGTPHYMSPEQSLGEQAVDSRTDQYALATVLYEMVAGEPPYTGATTQAIIAKRLGQPVPSVRTLRETAPVALEQALIKALAKAPADRFTSTGEFLLALSPSAITVESTSVSSSSAPRSRVRLTVIASVLALGATAAVWSFARGPVVQAASVIAVMPFAATSMDTALSRLGRDLAGTVSSTLDGVGDIRTVDRLTVLAQVAESRAAPITFSEAAALSRKFGATSFVHGTVSRDGALVRIDVSLYPTDEVTPIARAAIVGPPANLSALTDSVTWHLLADVWRRGTPPTPTYEAITTRSVAALRAYLDGERFLAAGNGAKATEAYSRAIEADSTFWFAYFRKGNSLGWADLSVDSATENAYRSHRAQLPPREQMLILAARPDSGFSRQRAQLEKLVERYPDYWPAWWMLADQLHHIYPTQLGTDLSDARRALETVVSLNPTLVLAWHHLAQAYAGAADSTGLVRALDNLQRLNAREALMEEDGTDYQLMFESRLALIRGRPSAASVIDTLYAVTVAQPGQAWLTSYLLSMANFGGLQVQLNQRLLAHGLPPGPTRMTTAALADAWASRGAWDSVLSVRDHAQRFSGDTIWALDTYRAAVIGAWVGALPVAEAKGRRENAHRLVAGRGPGYVAELAWLDGILAVTEGDASSLSAARTRVAQSKGVFAVRLDRSLGAFALAMRGDEAGAARAMAALSWDIGESEPFYVSRRASPHPLLRSVDHLAGAEWNYRAGDATQADRLLNFHDAVVGPLSERFMLRPLSLLLSARHLETIGDTAEASKRYAGFLMQYDAPTAAHQSLVIEARASLDRLKNASPDRGKPPVNSSSLLVRRKVRE